MRPFQIGPFEISEKRMFIIAEAGVNHDGNVDRAFELVQLAKESGADAVKFQAFTAEGLCDLQLKETKDVVHLTGGTKSSFAMYKALELSEQNLKDLKRYADEIGILFAASVFDEARADFLSRLDVPFFKISSGDLTHLPLLRYTASFGKPLIVSTGMGTLKEVERAVAVISEAGSQEMVFLHCTSDYPPKDEELNLNAIESMKETFSKMRGTPLSLETGYSDHSIGLEIPWALAGMKIAVLEKHFTIDENLPGPDHKLSLGPVRFRQMVDGIRKIEKARGSFQKQPSAKEIVNLLTTRRGAKAARDIQPGETIAMADIRFIKPAAGWKPEAVEALVGRTANCFIAANQPIEKEFLEEK